jgi:hypothetical protein
MRVSVRLVVFSSCLLAGAAGLVAQAPAQPAAGAQGAPGGARQGGAGGPAGGANAMPTNVKVLPKTWTRAQVQQLMSPFAESLGVMCSHCHAEDPNAPPPQPGQNPRLDYALDTKKEKDVAREMIKMVMSLNDATKSIGDAAVTEKVTCFTCHQGQKTPAKTPPNGWGRGSFTLSEQGPVVPQRGGGAAGGGPGGAPAGRGQ